METWLTNQIYKQDTKCYYGIAMWGFWKVLFKVLVDANLPELFSKIIVLTISEITLLKKD